MPIQEQSASEAAARKSLIVAKELIKVMFFLVATWKLLTSSFHFDMSKMDYSDIQSIVIGLFAIGLSVAFYFKANETSNQFYDNVYNFTKDTSELLGRIEAGFGEKLQHLDEGYSGLRDKVERIPFDLQNVRAKVIEEEEVVSKKAAERENLLEQLAERAKLGQAEKEQLFAELQKRDLEINKARNELLELKTSVIDKYKEEYPDIMIQVTDDFIRRYVTNFPSVKISGVYNAFENRLRELSRDDAYIRDLKRFQLITDDHQLTDSGKSYINGMSSIYNNIEY